MKKLLAMICILGTAAVLSACSSSSSRDVSSSDPVTSGRTAGDPVAPAERVFNNAQRK